ncbi:MAG: ATP-binding protein [Fibrobacterales bacterium]
MGRAEELFDNIKRDGLRYIHKMIEDEVSEELYLDYKRSADNGGNKHIHKTDRGNLSKAISGFSNTEGGLIIWGVECARNKVDDKDVPTEIHAIHNIKRYRSWMDSLVSGLTIPINAGIENIDIATGDDDGIMVSYIPKLQGEPLRSLYNEKYFMRSGATFVSIPHIMLSKMFGGHPAPILTHNYLIEPPIIYEEKVDIIVSIQLQNIGMVTSEEIFLNSTIICSINDDQKEYLKLNDHDNFFDLSKIKQFRHLISKPGIKITPNQFYTPLKIRIILDSVIERDFKIEFVYGCKNSIPQTYFMFIRRKNLEQVWRYFVENRNQELEDLVYDIIE